MCVIFFNLLSLYRHSNLELARWLIEHGIELADENGDHVDASYGSGGIDSAGRIFPASMKSSIRHLPAHLPDTRQLSRATPARSSA